MSTLWTPRGEVPVTDTVTAPSADSGGVGAEAGTGGAGAAGMGAPAGVGDEDFDFESLTPEEREQVEQYLREMAEARERLKQTPAAVVIANHAMGLYELAALHLASQPPDFAEATVAIDALGALLDGMSGRLGEPEATLREGLSQIRMAFVQLKNRHQDAASAESTEASDSSDDSAA